MTGHQIGDNNPVMQLADYLKAQGISDEDFGQAIGVTRQAVHRYKTYDRFPEKPVLTRILDVTAGAVTPNDFLEAQPEVEDIEKRGAA